MILTRSDLQQIIQGGDDSVTVDLGAVLGLRQQVHVGLDDIHELLQGAEPEFHVEVDAGNASVTVKRADSTWMATFAVRF